MQILKPSIVQRHRLGVVMAAVTLAVVALWLPTLDLARQFWIILVPIALFGLSHGGADPMIIKALETMRGCSSARWLGNYLILMAVAIALILWQPALALIGFLWLSAWHFATLDRLFMPAGTPSLAGWLSGSLPIIGPMAGHPEQVAVLFAWLLQQDAATLVSTVITTGYTLLITWGLGLTIVMFRTARRSRVSVLAELIFLLAALLLLPPLLGFAFYFCAIHSMRHFILLFASQRRTHPAFDIASLTRRATPATLGAILLGLLAWWSMQRWPVDIEANWLADGVRVVFWGLAVLTLPHALLVAIWIAPPSSSHEPTES